jgi:ABC-type Mn2+/Zn2+ transport system ATPase subunit
VKPSRAIAYVPQREVVDWDFPITVRGLVEMGRYPSLGNWGRFGAKDHEAVEEALHVCDLEDLADRQISALSGGQQQRAFLARAWAQRAEIYLLDEPFTGLDRNATEAFAAAMRRLRDAGKLVIASHHDLKSVEALFDQILLINGELVACGPTAEAFTTQNLDRAYGTHIFSGHAHHHHDHA